MEVLEEDRWIDVGFEQLEINLEGMKHGGVETFRRLPYVAR